MIKAYVGQFGSGKTLNMVYDAIQAMYRGRKIISNTPIKGLYDPFMKKPKYIQCEFISNGSEFQNAIAYRENCIFLVDEAAVYFPNQYWNKLPQEILVKFHQIRKYRTDIWYTTQGFEHALKRLRDLTNVSILCTRARIPGIRAFLTRRFIPQYFHGEQTKKKYDRFFLGKRILWPSDVKRVFRMYDTNYVVDTSAMMKVKGFQQPTQSKTRIEAEKRASLEAEAQQPVPNVN